VSKQLIYHYFKSKDELYGEMLTLISRENYRVLSAIDYESLDPVAAVRAYITTIFEQYVANPVAAIVTMDQILHGGAQIRLQRDARLMHEQLMGRVSEALERGKQEGVFSSEVSIEELEFMSIVNVTGCVSSRSMFARLLGREPFIDRGPAFWRDYAASFVLRAIRA
jgi:TetR/AcrR family transcriptional regulator